LTRRPNKRVIFVDVWTSSEHVNGEAHRQRNPRITTDTPMLEVPRYLVDWVGGLPPSMMTVLVDKKVRFFSLLWRGARVRLVSHTHSSNSNQVRDTHDLTLGQHISQHAWCAEFRALSHPPLRRQRVVKKTCRRRRARRCGGSSTQSTACEE